ncbi:MAG TPA: 23S rRNA (guanosine(2251)-2'-O)-methyltransferase RlmB [Candidatus Acidoferrales bacterium]|jgi:23S rRNA (guanosine2251-2'-O)-methyltransferase|nr:23S rRNA (guanosine(2251)-2'-O)-methyltransferase RlmB [Candidatus Acidoferrales bacterium]
MASEVIFGIHAVEEALAARGRRFEYVAVAPGRGDARIQKLAELCRGMGVAVRTMPRDQLTRLAKTAGHQGVVAVTAEKQYSDLDDLLTKQRGQYRFLGVLDGVEDPHNLGAIIRAAEGAGVDGLIIPERRASGVTATVVKASAGASEYLPIAKVTNIGRTLEELKERNIWTVGLDERGEKAYHDLDYKMDCAIVLGAEGHGLHEQIRRKCDFLVSIPMLGRIASLNVSVAAGVVMYEIARQRLFQQTPESR